jgi:ABC-2 type transport system permease protein
VVLLLLVATAAVMARKYYYASWLAATGARPYRLARPIPMAPSFLNFGRGKLFSLQTDALLRRDFWAFFREPSQWLHMFLMVMLLVIFLTSMGSLELKLAQPFLQTVSYLVIFLFDGFLIASVTLRFVFPAVSLEGDAFWCVRAAPISLRKVYWHKFIAAFLPVFLIAEILAVVSASMLRSGAVLVVMAAACSGFIAFALTSVNLGAGAYFAAFREKNPIRIASSQGASLTFLGSMVYLGCVVLVLMVPVNRYFETLILRGTAPSSWLLVPIGVVGALSVLVFLSSTIVGLATIRRDY